MSVFGSVSAVFCIGHDLHFQNLIDRGRDVHIGVGDRKSMVQLYRDVIVISELISTTIWIISFIAIEFIILLPYV